MLLARTITDVTLDCNGVFSTVIDSDNIIKDFDLTTRDKLGVITEDSELLIFVEYDSQNNQLVAFAQGYNNLYPYTLSSSSVEGKDIIERMVSEIA